MDLILLVGSEDLVLLFFGEGKEEPGSIGLEGELYAGSPTLANIRRRKRYPYQEIVDRKEADRQEALRQRVIVLKRDWNLQLAQSVQQAERERVAQIAQTRLQNLAKARRVQQRARRK